MERLVRNTFVSLDGIMQAPGAPDEDRTRGVSLGGWSAKDSDGMGQALDKAPGPYELLTARGAFTVTTHDPRGTRGCGDRIGPIR